MNFKKNILVTGGAGFIGSNLLTYFIPKYPNYNFIIIDILSYASCYDNIKYLEKYPNYNFLKGDILDYNMIIETFKNFNIDSIIHLAAESHVDNSIDNPDLFAKVNILGTLNLLRAAQFFWSDKLVDKLFYHISTDEVFGALDINGRFSEDSKYDPKSPYSSSKASSDHFVRAYHNTYKLPIIISNCSNNYGKWQHFEKLIPNTINCIKNQKKIPVYGDGKNIRDWIYVDDHIRMIDLIFHEGNIGETYCLGSNNELTNMQLVEKIIEISDKISNYKSENSKKLIEFVKDRPGHDFRYAIDSSKFLNQFKRFKFSNFEDSLASTVEYYLST